MFCSFLAPCCSPISWECCRSCGLGCARTCPHRVACLVFLTVCLVLSWSSSSTFCMPPCASRLSGCVLIRLLMRCFRVLAMPAYLTVSCQIWSTTCCNCCSVAGSHCGFDSSCTSLWIGLPMRSAILLMVGFVESHVQWRRSSMYCFVGGSFMPSQSSCTLAKYAHLAVHICTSLQSSRMCPWSSLLPQIVHSEWGIGGQSCLCCARYPSYPR